MSSNAVPRDVEPFGVEGTLRNALEAVGIRRMLVAAIREAAEECQRLDKAEKTTSCVGSGLSLAGCTATITGGVVTMVATGGAAAAVAVPALIYGGTALGVTGAATKIIGGVANKTKLDKVIARLRELVEEEARTNASLRFRLGMLEEPKYDKLDVLRDCGAVGALFVNTFGHAVGGRAVQRLVTLAVPSLQSFLKGALSDTMVTLFTVALVRGVDHGVEAVRAKYFAVQEGAKGLQHARQAVKGMADGPTKDYAVVAAQKAAEKALAEGADDVAEVAAAEAAKRAAGEAARTAAKVTGGITVGVGAAVAAWEIVQLVQRCKQKCRLAEQMRAMARDIEERLPATRAA